MTDGSRTTIAWHEVYLALTVLSAVLVALVRFGVLSLGRFPNVTVSAVIVALFTVTTLGYWYDVRQYRKPPPEAADAKANESQQTRDENERK